MVSSTLERELHEHLERLPERRQREVVEYARVLAEEMPKGVPGKDLLKFAGAIAPDDLELMKQAIEGEN